MGTEHRESMSDARTHELRSEEGIESDELANAMSHLNEESRGLFVEVLRCEDELEEMLERADKAKVESNGLAQERKSARTALEAAEREHILRPGPESEATVEAAKRRVRDVEQENRKLVRIAEVLESEAVRYENEIDGKRGAAHDAISSLDASRTEKASHEFSDGLSALVPLARTLAASGHSTERVELFLSLMQQSKVGPSEAEPGYHERTTLAGYVSMRPERCSPTSLPTEKLRDRHFQRCQRKRLREEQQRESSFDGLTHRPNAAA